MKRNICLIVLAVSLVGCNMLKKIPGIGGAGSKGPDAFILPDDYRVTGTTIADNQTLYLPTGSLTDNRQIIAKVKRPGEDWVTLYKDPDYSYIAEYRIKAGPPSDSFTFKSKVVKDGSQYRFPGPVAPTGTQYEIRSIKLVTEHNLY